MAFGNIASAVPAGVFPQTLSTSFSLSMGFPLLANRYHDGTYQCSLITDGVNPPRAPRIWKQSKRLQTSDLAALFAFWKTTVNYGLLPFYFYDPFEPSPGQPIGSNYDPSGASSQGRVVCFLRGGQWKQEITLGRNNVPGLELVECA
jgi:hypothetical protein